MKTKRTMLVSGILIAVVLMSIVFAIAIVFSANQQNINSQITISYRSNGVSANVKCWYQIGSGEKTYLQSDAGNEMIQLRVGETNTDAFTIPTTELSKVNKGMVIGYDFENVGSAKFAGMQTFDENQATQNMDLTYSLNGTNYDTLDTGFSLSGGESTTYYFQLNVADLGLDAVLDGSIIWELDVLTSATGTDVDTDVARIGATSYATFEEAYAAAESGDVVAISEDVTLSETFTVNDGMNIVAESDVASAEVSATSTDVLTITTLKTINVDASKTLKIGVNNGTTINIVSSNTNLDQIFYVGTNGKLNLGKVKSSNYSKRCIYADSKSSVELTGVEVSAFESRVLDVAYNCNIIIKNSSFTNNTNDYVIHSESSVNIDNCVFENNASAVWGINLEISNSVFKNNVSSGYAGAIYYYRGTSTIKNCEFLNNSATNDGGAIFCH
ncbi:MAG: hypothetical protein IJW36_00790, partial [Clostridia bacterium]|nr:hypothetical protein [Clostridia bacterium]